MDAESITAIRLLETIAQVRQILIDFSISIRQRGIRDSISSLDCRTYRGWGYESLEYTMLEAGVSAELPAGGVDWYMEAEWNDTRWLISTHVNISRNIRDAGQETLKEFPDRETDSFDEFLRHLVEAAQELVTYTEPLK